MTTEKQAERFRSATLQGDKRGSVKRTAVITEGVGNIAARARPESGRDPPVSGVGVSTGDILRDLATLEPPDRNLRIVPEHGENTTAGRVEGCTSAAIEIAHGATGVITVRAHALSAEGVAEVALGLRTVFVPVFGAGVGVQSAASAGTSVQRVLIDGCRVHVFDDIDLVGGFGFSVSVDVFTRRRKTGAIVSPPRCSAM